MGRAADEKAADEKLIKFNGGLMCRDISCQGSYLFEVDTEVKIYALAPMHLLLLSSKYCGCSLLQFGQGLSLPYFSKHSLQSSLPHLLCCHGSSAISRHTTHWRLLSGSSVNLYIVPLPEHSFLDFILEFAVSADTLMSGRHAPAGSCL